MRALVAFEVKVPVRIFKSEVAYVAHCPVFDVASQGRTGAEARKNIIEALIGFLTTCFEMGTLDEVLKESGFEPVQTPDSELCMEPEEETVQIPLPFMIKNQNPEVCRA